MSTKPWMLVRDRVARSGDLVGAPQRLPERDPVAARERLHARLRALTDAALGGVEDAPQRHLVVGVGQHPQVGQRVSHLAPLVEPHPADHAVGHADPDEDLLEHPGLGVGAVEDRDVAGPRLALVGQPVDLLGDEPGLVVLVVADVADDPVAVAGVGPEVLRLAPVVAADHRVGGVEDGLGRAVVLLQQDRGRVGEVDLEVHDVADVGAAERVDRLVGVADHHQLRRGHRSASPPPSGASSIGVGAQLVDEGVLGVVGVLVLVDEHVPEPPPPALPHLRERPEQVHGHHQQVVEVERVGAPQPTLVLGVRGGVRLLLVVAGVLGGVLVVEELVLGVGDPVQDRAAAGSASRRGRGRGRPSSSAAWSRPRRRS